MNTHATLQELQNQLERLKPAVTITAEAIYVAEERRKAVEEIARIFESLEVLSKESIITITAQASDTINESEKLADDLLSSTKMLLSGFVKSVELKLHEELGNLKNTVEKEVLEYRKLVEAAERLIGLINSINFPQRLDKIDASVSSINIGLQNIQAKLENLERSLKDDIEINQQKILILHNMVVQTSKNQGSKITWMLIALILNGLLCIAILIFVLLG